MSTWLYFFTSQTSQLCFCLETERKFTQVAYDNIKKDCEIHIEVPVNYSSYVIKIISPGSTPIQPRTYGKKKKKANISGKHIVKR